MAQKGLQQKAVTLEQFYEACKTHLGNKTLICKELDLSRRSIYRYLEDPEYKKAYELSMEDRIDFVENKLMSKINDGNVQAMIFFLKTQAKNRGYVERVEHIDKTLVFDDSDIDLLHERFGIPMHSMN